jgi:hypothetical protein
MARVETWREREMKRGGENERGRERGGEGKGGGRREGGKGHRG